MTGDTSRCSGAGVEKNGKNIGACFIWARDYDSNDPRGRSSITIPLQRSSESLQSAKQLRVHQILEHRHIHELVIAAWRWALSLLRKAPLPFQCLLYSSYSEEARIINALSGSNFQIVYIEGIRLYTVLAAVRKALPNAHIVVDMDDLLSRRYKTWLKKRLPIATGHLDSQLPIFLKKLLKKTRIASSILHYEYRTLERCELNAAMIADTVVLNSTYEAKLLQNRLSKARIEKKARIVTILPPVEYRKEAIYRILPIHFIFIGADRIAQNKMSIKYLLDVWNRLKPQTQIHIYGRMRHIYKPVSNVHFHGFVNDLQEVYTDNAVLLAPSILAGGIKTKVLECFSYGCPVIGTKETFEGLELGNYELAFNSTDELENIILNPNAFLDELNRCAFIGNKFIRMQKGVNGFLQRWSKALHLPLKFKGI